MEVVFFDVGLGDCTIISSRGKYVLVDGGSWFPDSLKVFIQKNHIKKIDTIVCTHLHGDHIDGLVDIVSQVNCGKIYGNTKREESNNDSFKKLLFIAENKGIEYYVPIEKEQIRFGDASITFYNTQTSLQIDENDRSLICHVEFGTKSILLPGDASDSVIKNVIAENSVLRADIFHLPHHGMIDISDSTIKSINPSIGIISYAKNRHGVLSNHLLDALKLNQTKVYQTNKGGNLFCSINNDSINVKCSIEDSFSKNNKLLLLGANSETRNHVETAKRLGVYSIVIDNIPSSPAKEIADEAYDIDGKDVVSIVSLFHKRQLDGILIGVADPLLPTYFEVAKQLMLPILPLCKDDALSFFTDKKKFKELCQNVGLNVVPEYYVGTDIDDVALKNVCYPCIVKPTISRGGNAVFLCNNINELQNSFVKAKRQSDDGTVCIEAFMDCVDVCAYYFFCDGVPYLLAVTDRISLNDKKSIVPVTYGNVYPSDYTQEFIDQCDGKLTKIFHDLQIRNGVFSMQIFWDGKKFYPYDPSGILGAEMTNPIFPKVLKIDLIEHFIKYSLTGNMQCNSVPSAGGAIPDDKCAESIWILLKPGEIGSIDGVEAVSNYNGVLGICIRLGEGSVVKDDYYNTEKSVFARVWISARTKNELLDLEEKIRQDIKVFDTYGNYMINDNT